MKFLGLITGLVLAFLVGSTAIAAPARNAFGFNSGLISGFPTGSVRLTGGGAYDPATSFIHASGSFDCVTTVSQGPLTNCLAGEGVKWDTDSLQDSVGFKCTGAAAEALKTATTNDQTVVLKANFYRAGDGEEESFHAVDMIVSETDLDPGRDGMQNVWIRAVGCGSALVHFNNSTP